MKKGSWKRNDLPIILNHETRTGILVFRNRGMGGRDLVIVGLNKEVPSGEQFDFSDIEWVKAVLHFTDVETMQITVDIMTKELKQWSKERKVEA